MTYLNHAWNGTNTWWGKISLVLFYLFIWVNILSGIWSLIVPESQGMDCLFDDEGDHAKTSLLTRGCNLFGVAFLFYADKSGLHSWNVGTVGVVCILWFWMWMMFLKGNESEASCAAIWSDWAWIWPVWIVFAFFTILIDEKMGNRTTDGGTAEERQTLK
jgi:hypothetical protein